MRYLIAITGGIGSGKSVVSKILTSMGYCVYDCDKRAKSLMDASDEIKARISSEVLGDCVVDGMIDRQRLAEKVFKDEQALTRLNEIVHSAVRNDLIDWSSNNTSKIQFVETAIPYQSGLEKIVDKIWEVDAPLNLRIERVMCRNSMTREAVLSRITSQNNFIPRELHSDIVHIVNDGDIPLLPQIEALLSRLLTE
ncbi:MAG: dephospho-CoA kinase [Muribaculum sp.]|nr:dephospho-CoA kinase [Muribaculum sp.]